MDFTYKKAARNCVTFPTPQIPLIKPVLVLCELLRSSWESNHRTRLKPAVCFPFCFIQKENHLPKFVITTSHAQEDSEEIRSGRRWSLESWRKTRGRGPNRLIDVWLRLTRLLERHKERGERAPLSQLLPKSRFFVLKKLLKIYSFQPYAHKQYEAIWDL